MDIATLLSPRCGAGAPRNAEQPTGQKKAWYQPIVDQTSRSSLMKRYGTIEEQAGSILFLACDEATRITSVTLPEGSGELA